MRAILLVAAVAVALSGHASAATQSCTSPADPFLNPFSRASAHHRPIGDGAQYAPADHPSSVSWRGARSININAGAPWGVSVAETDATDPLVTIGAVGLKCGNVVGFPRSIRLPKEGFVTRVVLSSNGCTDGVVVVYDRPTETPHQIRQYNWNNGKPLAGQYKTWSISGLGHGTRPGDRVGTSASGVAALFGVLRGDEINIPGRKVEHALQMALPSKPGHCANMLSRKVVLPAVTGDGAMNSAGHNQGNIPYGALMALPTVAKGGPSLDSMGLTERGRRLVEAVRDYGIYVVDQADCVAMRADQYVKNTDELKAALAKVYPHMRMVLNNDVLGSPTAGGGAGIAPNCAIDAERPAPVDGTCGPANGVAVSVAPTSGLCGKGIASAVSGSGPWAWTCAGQNGGASNSCSAPVNVVTPPPAATLRIDAGSPVNVEAGGVTWLADRYFIGGTVADRGPIAITGTDAPRIYQTERYQAEGYEIPADQTAYTVRLHFAETWPNAVGNRVFGVTVEGVAIDALDVSGQAGGLNAALVKTLDRVPVSDGSLSIRFSGKHPIINAIEVTRAAPPEEVAPPVDPKPSGKTGRVRVSGGTVVAANGALLRGASMMILGKPGYATDRKHWESVRALGLNAVRLDVKTVQIGKTVAEQLPQLDKAVDIAGDLGMYVMLKTSVKPGGYDLAALKAFWSVVAPRYKNRTHVIYELTNEPVSGGPRWGDAKQWTDKVIADLSEVYRIIRAGAPDTHVALFSTPNLYPDCAAYKAVIAKMKGVDWTKASVAFHHYRGTEQFGEAGIQCLRAAYPLVMNETNYWHSEREEQNLRTVLRLYEKIGMSWFSLDGKGSVAHLKNEILPDLRSQGYAWPKE